MATHQKKHIKHTGNTKELLTKEDSEEYGEIISSKGDFRYEIKISSTNAVVIGKLRGSLIKGPSRTRIEKGDIVLCQVDKTNYNFKYYISHKYSKDHIKGLKKMGELVVYVDNDINSNVIFDNDIELKEQEIAEINDDFIAGI